MNECEPGVADFWGIYLLEYAKCELCVFKGHYAKCVLRVFSKALTP